MRLLNWIGLGNQLTEPIKAVGNLYTTDKERLKGEANLEEITQKPQLAQIETNKLYAMSSVLFNSGWMPLLGWTAGFLILLFYMPQILIITYVWGKNCILTDTAQPFPMKPDDILNLVYLLFGMGGLGIARKKIIG
jgi:hypothetical protein